jgi:hypothetical protein
LAEPLRVILTVSAICSGVYALAFLKKAISNQQFYPEYFLQILIGFVAVTMFGMFIWGIVALAQAANKKAKTGKPRVRHP